MPKPGDRCPDKCGGQLIVATSRKVGDMQMRYLKCNCCGKHAGKSFIPASQIFSRSR